MRLRLGTGHRLFCMELCLIPQSGLGRFVVGRTELAIEQPGRLCPGTPQLFCPTRSWQAPSWPGHHPAPMSGQTRPASAPLPSRRRGRPGVARCSAGIADNQGNPGSARPDRPRLTTAHTPKASHARPSATRSDPTLGHCALADTAPSPLPDAVAFCARKRIFGPVRCRSGLEHPDAFLRGPSIWSDR